MANVHGNELGIYINADSTDIAAYEAATGVTLETITPFSYIDDIDADDAPNSDLGTTTSGGNWVLVACSTSCSLNLSNATIETTCKKDTAGALQDASVRHTIAGQQTWNMSVDGLLDLTSGGTGQNSFADLMDLAINRNDIIVAFSTGNEGQAEYVGMGFISSIDATAGVDDFATYSCTIEGNGDLTKRTTNLTS